MKEVVIYSHSAGSPQIGPNIRVYNLAKALTEQGYNVSIVASGFFHKYNSSQVSGFINQQEIDGIDYLYLWNIEYENKLLHLLNIFFYSFFSVIVSFLYFRRISTAIISTPPLVPLGPAIIHKIFGGQLFFDIRDQWPEILKDLGSSLALKVYSIILRLKKKIFLAFTDKIMVVKEGEPLYLQETYDIEKSNIIYIPNGLLLNERPSVSLQPSYGKRLRIVYVGSLNHYYKLAEFCELVSKYDFLEFHIYGSGIQKDEIEKFAKSCDNIKFHGRIPPDEVIEVLGQYDLAYNGLQDSEMNRYGISTNKLFEYFYVGLPVISFCKSDYDPVRISGAGFAGSSVTEMNDTLQNLQNISKVNLAEMGKKGKEYLYDNHNFYKNINKFISHLN